MVAEPPPRQAPSPLATLLASALVGGIAGGLLGAGLALQSATVSQQVGPNATASPVSFSAERGSPVDTVRAVLPAVVTVVNKVGGQPVGSGSGVVIDRERGFVVTNSHVVEEPRSTRPSSDFDVILFDGTKLAASAVGNDPETDVGVLRVQGRLLAQAQLGDSAAVPLGAPVVAIGSPGSAVGIFQNTVTSGIVSGKGRRLPRDEQIFLEDLVQTDAPINPGNSGGPLVLVATREVIGLNTLVIRPRGEEGLSFAVSSNTVKRISEEIIAKGRVVRGRIGIAYEPNNPQFAAFYRLGTSKGVVITEVVAGSPAAAVGLRRLDVLTRINEQEIDEVHPIRTVLLNFRPGDRVTVTLVREGREQSVVLTLAAPTSDVGPA